MASSLKSFAFGCVSVVALCLAACSQFPVSVIPTPLRPAAHADTASTVVPSEDASREITVTKVAAPPFPAAADVVRSPSGPPLSNRASDATISFTFQQLALPQFAQLVYGRILQRAVTFDPVVAARTDLVTIRTGKPQTPAEIEQITRALLKSYGVAVIETGSFVRIVPDAAALGYSPLIKRGRALPETPEALRPVFQLIEMQAIPVQQATSQLRLMFGARIQILDDVPRNAVLIGGQGDDIAAVIEAIRVLDQPLMKGRNAIKITPVFWSVEDLSRRIGELLSAQGYAVSNPSIQGQTGPVQLVPIPAINTLFVFAVDPKLADYVTQWAKELDRPSSRGIGTGYFTYPVKHIDAESLAKTIQALIDGAPATATAATSSTQAGAAGQVQTGANAPRRSRVVVNAASNTLIFQGSSEEYAQWIGLLQELDRPAKSALVEVTVAEITLDDRTQLGVQWYDLFRNGTNIASLGGTALGLLPNVNAAGFAFTRVDSAGRVRAAINLLASTGKARVLSTPRVMARNGETATIQVGQEIPIVTSNLSNANTGGVGGVLQTIQYRSTGVILTVKPVIHSSGRVDVDLTQEVSTPGTTAPGATSPPINTRKATSNMTMRDGSSVLLAGLMQQTINRSNDGIPLLKDIPYAGALFRNTIDTLNKTELVILVTTYVIEDDNDADLITNAVKSQFDASDAWRPGPTIQRLRPSESDVHGPNAIDKPPSVQGPIPTPLATPPAQ